jgi:hypothetical protein
MTFQTDEGNLYDIGASATFDTLIGATTSVSRWGRLASAKPGD